MLPLLQSHRTGNRLYYKAKRMAAVAHLKTLRMSSAPAFQGRLCEQITCVQFRHNGRLLWKMTALSLQLHKSAYLKHQAACSCSAQVSSQPMVKA